MKFSCFKNKEIPKENDLIVIDLYMILDYLEDYNKEIENLSCDKFNSIYTLNNEQVKMKSEFYPLLFMITLMLYTLNTSLLMNFNPHWLGYIFTLSGLSCVIFGFLNHQRGIVSKLLKSVKSKKDTLAILLNNDQFIKSFFVTINKEFEAIKKELTFNKEIEDIENLRNQNVKKLKNSFFIKDNLHTDNIKNIYELLKCIKIYDEQANVMLKTQNLNKQLEDIIY